jgi:hypothetical protein
MKLIETDSGHHRWLSWFNNFRENVHPSDFSRGHAPANARLDVVLLHEWSCNHPC